MALTDNLVSYWKFDESSGNAADSVGSNTLTNNGTTGYTPAKINNGIAVDSTSKYLSILDSVQTGLDITGSLSISFWVKFATGGLPGSGEGLTLCRKYDSPSRSYYCLLYNNAGSQELSFYFTDEYNVADKGIGIVGWSPSVNTWYHIVMVFDASVPSIKFFVNGSQQGTTQTPAINSIFAGSSDIFIMRSGGAGQNYIADEYGIWSRTLSADEVANLYRGGAGWQYPFLPYTNRFTDLFNSYSDGDLNGQGSWVQFVGTNDFTVGTTNPYEGAKSIRFHNADNEQIKYRNSFTAVASGSVWGYLYADAGMGAADDGAGMDFIKLRGDANTTGVGGIYYEYKTATANIKVMDATGAVTIGYITKGAWHKLQVDFDTSLGTNGQYRIIIDDGTPSDWIEMQADHKNQTDVDTIWVVGYINAGTDTYTYIDSFGYTPPVDKTFTSDGIVKIIIDKTLTSDGRVKIVPSELFDNDGIIKIVPDKTFTSDGIVTTNAVIRVKQSTGVTPDNTIISNLRFSSDDVVNGTTRVGIPASGTDFSYWKSFYLDAITSPKGTINNIKFYTDGGVFGNGVTVKGNTASAYTQATDDSELTTSSYPALAGSPTDIDAFVEGSPLAVPGSISNPSTGKISDWVVLQANVAFDAIPNAQSAEVFYFKYDET